MDYVQIFVSITYGNDADGNQSFPVKYIRVVGKINLVARRCTRSIVEMLVTDCGAQT